MEVMGMDVKDLTGLGEPIKKLIEVVARGIGNVYQPYQLKRLADAKAYEIKTVGNALGSVSDVNQLPINYKDGVIDMGLKPVEPTPEQNIISASERVERRINFQEEKRQANIESVVAVAAEQLRTDEKVSPEMLDEDWITRFFDTSQNISSEQMQILWGRILAGEIRQPGSYSLRTLDFIRNLRGFDAVIIEHISKFAFRYLYDYVIIHTDDGHWLEQNKKLYLGHLIAGSDLGILNPIDVRIKIFNEPSQPSINLDSAEKLVVLNRTPDTAPFSVKAWKFTPVGAEVVKLCAQPMDQEYLEELGRFFSSKNIDVKIGDITGRDEEGIHYSNAKTYPAVSGSSS